MRKRIGDNQIKDELQASFRPSVLDSGITLLPLSNLSDREFEMLIYLLLQEEISQGEHPVYADIGLMSGVGERGRDCVLYRDGSVVGLVQCKKYQGRVTRPVILTEIIKFVMFSILDSELMPNCETFDYLLFVSNDFNEPAKRLIHSFVKEIDKEITSSKINNYINRLIEDYESFSVFAQEPPISEVTNILRKIRLHSYNVVDLSDRINKKPDILRLFFNVQMVSSLEETERVIKSVIESSLKDLELKSIRDADVKILQARIENIPDAKRISLGIVDIFGYPTKFIKRMRNDFFGDFVVPLTELKLKLNKRFIDFIREEIRLNVEEKVTENLLKSYKVHPFSVQLAVPYLERRNLKKVFKNNVPSEVYAGLNPDSVKSADDIINEIRDYLLNIAESVIREDFHAFSEPTESFELKVGITKHIYSGFKTVADARAQFEKDILVLKPTLDEIDIYIDSIMLDHPTIVLKDGAFLEEKNELKRVVKSLSYLGKEGDH